MAQVCEVCGKGPQFGNNISHAHNITRRQWSVNLRPEGQGQGWRRSAQAARLHQLHQERQGRQSVPESGSRPGSYSSGPLYVCAPREQSPGGSLRNGALASLKRTPPPEIDSMPSSFHTTLDQGQPALACPASGCTLSSSAPASPLPDRRRSASRTSDGIPYQCFRPRQQIPRSCILLALCDSWSDGES